MFFAVLSRELCVSLQFYKHPTSIVSEKSMFKKKFEKTIFKEYLSQFSSWIIMGTVISLISLDSPNILL